MRGDRDAAVRRSAQIESRFTDMQVRALERSERRLDSSLRQIQQINNYVVIAFTQTSLDRLTMELTSEQDRLRAQQESESRVRSSEEHLQSQLKLRTEQVHDLELKLKAVRQEADAQLQTTVRPRVPHTMTSLHR